MEKSTKEKFNGALKTLLRKKSWEDITVTELANEVGVTRQTFYYYFQDIYDLMEWSINKEIFTAFDKRTDYENWKIYLIQTLKYFQTNRKMIFHIVNSLVRVNFEQQLKKDFEPIIEKIVRFYKEKQKETREISEKDFQFIVRTYTLLLVGLIIEWINCGMKDKAEEFICPYINLIEESHLFFIEKFI